MASAARIAAYRLTARESTGPARPGAGRRSALRHPPAELGSTARPTASGEIPRQRELAKQSRFIERDQRARYRWKANSMQPGTALASPPRV